jgi:hypothetical protein
VQSAVGVLVVVVVVDVTAAALAVDVLFEVDVSDELLELVVVVVDDEEWSCA